MSTDLSSLSYTSRDYISIFNDLVAAIPSLTTVWTNRDETDPGIVLIKLMAMLGDCLSYNQDKMALEVYPGSVTQRKNASKIFDLGGYKMHWYRSARIPSAIVTVSGGTASNTISKFSPFSTVDNKTTYTLMSEVSVPGPTGSATISLVEGSIVTPSKMTPTNTQTEWFDYYDYNVLSNSILDGRIPISNDNVDENNIILVDSSRDTWTKVDDLATITDAGKYFELDVDDYDRPYIKLVDYWNTNYSITGFKLFYLISSGSQGSVAPNTLNFKGTIDSNAMVSITHPASSVGYDPDTPDDARRNSAKIVKSADTLIQLKDFANAISSIDNVANVIVTDKTNDPGTKDSGTGVYSPIDNYVVKAYVISESSFNSSSEGGIQGQTDSELEQQIVSDLSKYKIIPLTLIVDTSNITDIYWTPQGVVYLNEPVTPLVANNLLNKINMTLNLLYNPSEVSFNTKLDFLTLVSNILNSDPSIAYVDLKPINYINPYSEKTSDGSSYLVPNIPQIRRKLSGEEVLTGIESFSIQDVATPATIADSTKYKTYTGNLINPSYYSAGDSSPFLIRPNSIFIKIDSGAYTIMDDGQGNLVNYDGVLYESGTINYQTGAYTFTISNSYYLSDYKPLVSMMYNVVSIPTYRPFSTDSSNLIISPSSLIS